MKKNFLFAFVTVVVFLVLSDLALRLFLAPLSRPFEWPPPDMTKHGLMPDETLFWKLRPVYNEPWRLYKLVYTSELDRNRVIDFEVRKRIVAPLYEGVTWEVNEQGFRGTSLLKEKSKGSKRLLFLGSSVTFGWGASSDRAFPELVRKGLEQVFPGVHFETINAGVPGYSSYQGFQYLKKILPGYAPDVVVAEFGINDGTMAVGKEDKDWEPGFWDPIRKALRNSGWGRLVLNVFGPVVKKSDVVSTRQTKAQAEKNFYRVSMAGTATRVAPDDFKANLESMADMCQKNGALFFVLVPCLFNEYGDKEVVPAVNMVKAKTISMQDMLLSQPPQALETMYLPYDEGHLSGMGHKVVAKGIVAFLVPKIKSILKNER